MEDRTVAEPVARSIAQDGSSPATPLRSVGGRYVEHDGLDTLFVGSAAECLAAAESPVFAKGSEFRSIGFVDVELPPASGAIGHIGDIHLLLGASRASKVVVCGHLSDLQFQSVVDAALAGGCRVLSVLQPVGVTDLHAATGLREFQPLVQVVDRTWVAPRRAGLTATGLRIEVYADGANLDEMLQAYRAGLVRGFTTNPTLMRKAGVRDYAAFARSVLIEIRDLPISFEAFADEFGEMERQALMISSWGDNVFVKIPVTNTKGESSIPLVRNLVAATVKVNVTALMTEQQVAAVAEVLSPSVPAIVSVFAGRIADTGRDPIPMMRRSARLVSGNPSARLLWASPREVLNIYQAEACGCHIITVTKPLLDKLSMRGMDLDELSRQTVNMFYSDAQAAEYSLR
jgi:transaldolase